MLRKVPKNLGTSSVFVINALSGFLGNVPKVPKF